MFEPKKKKKKKPYFICVCVCAWRQTNGCLSVHFWNACDLRLSSNWLVSDCPRGADHSAQDPPTLDLSESIFFYFIFWRLDHFQLSNRHHLSSEMKVHLILTWPKYPFTRHSNEEKHKIQMQILEIGRSWRAGRYASHAFYCFSWSLFQSPVTEALAMTRKVIRTMQFNLSRSSRSKHVYRSCSCTMVVFM